MDFGAFVNFFGSRDGLVHISQLAANRVQKTSDVVKEGDKVKVKLLGLDDRGKVRLSMKVVDQETGEDLEAKQKDEREPREAASGDARSNKTSLRVFIPRDLTVQTIRGKGGLRPPFFFTRGRSRGISGLCSINLIASESAC